MLVALVDHIRFIMVMASFLLVIIQINRQEKGHQSSCIPFRN